MSRIAGGEAEDLLRALGSGVGTPGVKARARLQALVSAGGLDLTVGRTLIAEGLAHVYICGVDRCPRRQGWCQ